MSNVAFVAEVYSFNNLLENAACSFLRKPTTVLEMVNKGSILCQLENEIAKLCLLITVFLYAVLQVTLNFQDIFMLWMTLNLNLLDE